MSDFDKPLIIRKRGVTTKAARTKSQINAAQRQGGDVEKKVSSGHNKAHQGTDHQLIAKIARENDVAPPAKVSLIVGQAIQAARKELELSQKGLAQKINEKPAVISTYESGIAIPSSQILAKLERALHVKLRGSEIGKKLGTPKKLAPVAAPEPA